MIHSRNLVPKYLTENSKDVHTFLRLIDLAFNNIKAKTDDFISILNPDKCPDRLLPLLASYVGYKYDFNEDYEGNRVIIRSYKDMKRNKGNIVGIQLASSVAISMKADKTIIDTQEMIDVTYYDKYYVCNNCGYIAYNKFDECPNCESTDISEVNNNTIVIVIEYPLYSAKLYDLVEAVRPVGTKCIVYNGSIVKQEETLGIADYVKLQSRYLNDGQTEVGSPDAVSGFTVMLKDKPQFKYCETCGYYVLASDEQEICPRCGSSFVLENNSSLRSLYRLYNTSDALKTTIKNIVMGINNVIINNNESNYILNNSDNVGIILRINVEGTKTIDDIDWTCLFTQSFIFGLKPYIELDSGESYIQYTMKDILKKLSESNKTILNVLSDKFDKSDNKNTSSFSYDLIYDSANEKYAIQASYWDTTDGTPHYHTHNYYIKRAEIRSMFSLESNPGTINTDLNVVDVNDVYSETTYNFRMGNDTITEKEHFEGIKKSNDNTFVDFQGNYIYVCRACNRIIDTTTEDITVCPFCGGIITPDYAINSSSQVDDHTILKGSYVLDLYFDDTDTN